MFHHNNTQVLMENKFQAEDYKFIHQMARESRGEEKKRRQEVVLHAEAKIAKQANAAKMRKEKATATAQKNSRNHTEFGQRGSGKAQGTKSKGPSKGFPSCRSSKCKVNSSNCQSSSDQRRKGLQKATPDLESGNAATRLS